MLGCHKNLSKVTNLTSIVSFIAYNMSDSESDFESTSPQIVDQALDAVNHLLPKKSKGKSEMVYEKFKSWRRDIGVEVQIVIPLGDLCDAKINHKHQA